MRARRFALAGAAALALVASSGALVGPAHAAPGDPCNSKRSDRAYIECRLDRLEKLLVDAHPAGPAPTPTPTPSATATPTATPSPSVTPSPTPTPSGSTAPAGFDLQPVDGGPDHYGRWTKNTLPTDPAYFPVGVWMEQGGNADRMAGYGINLIVNPVGGQSTNPAVKNLAALEDEPDMWAGPGDAAWTGKYPGQGDICDPANARCGYTIMKTHNEKVEPGEHRYTNYGKGIGFWETDAEAARFVNEFQDTVSIDLYWGTDQDLCQESQGGRLLGTGATVPEAECRKPANYGAAVDRVRDLVTPAGSKPVYNYIEVGHPGTNGGTMPVAKIKPAVWSSLIHEARGIVYFNHSFGGVCQSQHVLDDCDPAIAREVTAINAQLKSLAPVLNSPKIKGVTTTGDIDALAKWDGKNVHVFTGSTKATGSTSGSVTVPGVKDGVAEVLGEGRTVPVVAGKIADTWADPNAVHLYKIV